jgi:glycosyltransferase involved in cell wall biosynthesis
MKVLFYTSAPFLDVAIEMINILKKDVDLHVLIEITPGTAMRADIDILPDNRTIISAAEILKEDNYKFLESYFEGCASANFVVHTSESGFSFSTIKVIYKTWQFISKIQPDIIHLEAITLRSLGLFPFVFLNKRIFITLHDSLPHSGENNWKMFLPRLLYLKIPYQRSYFFYSTFSKIQFEQYYKKDKHIKFTMRMHPYSLYQKYAKGIPYKKHILFFGSHSPYKGINILLQAMPSVFKAYPDELLVIAGLRKEGYVLEEDIIEAYKNRIILLDRYISNDELVALLQESKFVVCPYLDATQSGVLMTAYALNKPVVASNVGAFPEYIEQNETGLLVPAGDPEKLANGIMHALKDNLFDVMENNITELNKTTSWADNKPVLFNAYNS